MKMSEVFHLPLRREYDDLMESNNRAVSSDMHEDDCDAIILAVNHHDQLVEVISVLLAAMETGSNMEMFDAEKTARELLKAIGEGDE